MAGPLSNEGGDERSDLTAQPASDSATVTGVDGDNGPLIVFFDDTRLMRDLLGDYDANLAVLEDRLGIEAVVNGTAVSLRGPKEACQTAKAVLENLYQRLSAGEAIGLGEVVGSIRHTDLSQPVGTGTSGNGTEAQQIRTRKRLVTARTRTQSAYIAGLERNDLVFASGPAGTGKTYLAVVFAAAALESGRCDRIILSRPAVEAGERLGFLPGDMREKVDPYLRPLYDALYDVLAPERVERGLATGAIEIAPLAFMRGRTLSNAIVILDEAQNCTPVQMKMFLTRLGENSKMVVTGDPTQIDLPPGKDSGLVEAIRILDGLEGISHIAFTGKDVVRRELVARIVDAYETASDNGRKTS